MDISKSNNENDSNKKLPIVKVGKRNLAAVFITLNKEDEKNGRTDNILSFTPKEKFVLETFLDVKNYEQTAEICDIDVKSVKRYLRRPDLKRYLEELIEQAAINSGTTINWLIATLRKTAEGTISPDDIQMKALKEIREIIKPKTPGVAVNINSENKFYSGMDQGTLDAEILDAERTAKGF